MIPPSRESEPPEDSTPAPDLPLLPPESKRPSRPVVAWLLGIILLFLLYQNYRTSRSDSAQAQAVAKKAQERTEALSLTKSVYLFHQWASVPSDRTLQNDMIAKWREITTLPNVRVSDWRRLGIVQGTFRRKDALPTFQRIPKTLPPPALLPGQRRLPLLDQPVTVPMEQEMALWDALYGPKKPDKRKRQEYAALLHRLDLGWLENLALEQLYTRTNAPDEATRVRQQALVSAQRLFALNLMERLLLLLGVPGLLVLTLYNRTNRNKTSPLPPRPISYKTGAIGFVIYLLAPMLFTLPLGGLRNTTRDWSVLALGRLEIGLYLTVAGLSVIAAVLFVRGQMRRESPESGPPSLRDVLASIGLRSRNVFADVSLGFAGHILLLPLLLLAGMISHALFSRYPTPAHPTLLWLIALNLPLDRLLQLLQTAVMAAISEEMMFRGLLYPALRERWGVGGGIFASAAIFALMHPTLPGGFLTLWTLGAAFAYAYEKRGSLLPGIVMHALNNGLLLLTEFAALAS